MPKYVIERNIPGVGNLSTAELHGVALTSCNVLREMGPEIQWVQSYIVDDKTYCIYLAPDEDAIRQHARLSGFPANRISRVATILDPAASE